jgi:hypothetical protein
MLYLLVSHGEQFIEYVYACYDEGEQEYEQACIYDLMLDEVIDTY